MTRTSEAMLIMRHAMAAKLLRASGGYWTQQEKGDTVTYFS
jgi:hypothetical protein